MPEGRSLPMPHCGLPGILPSARPREFSLGAHRFATSSNLSSILQIKHNFAQKVGNRTNDMYSKLSRIAGLISHQLITGRILPEPPDIEVAIYKSRTRLPAINQYQTRDLRHGCQGSKSLTQIMEE